jgi:hypothetical protein
MQYFIWIVSPSGYIHSDSFIEQASCLQEAFSELGYSVPILRSEPVFGKEDHKVIILAAHLLRQAVHNPHYIIYNLEQVFQGSPWLNKTYVRLLQMNEVWDYSQENISTLDYEYGVKAKLMEIGYSPCLSTIERREEDIDVLFYGCINDRRKKILDDLIARGINVKVLFGVYGKERDEYISRAKVVLNLHYYDAKVFEITRCFYLMANRKFIISERGNDKQLEEPFEKGIWFCNYDEIVAACVGFLQEDGTRRAMASVGYRIMSSRKQTDFLRKVI